MKKKLFTSKEPAYLGVAIVLVICAVFLWPWLRSKMTAAKRYNSGGYSSGGGSGGGYYPSSGNGAGKSSPDKSPSQLSTGRSDTTGLASTGLSLAQQSQILNQGWRNAQTLDTSSIDNSTMRSWDTKLGGTFDLVPMRLLENLPERDVEDYYGKMAEAFSPSDPLGLNAAFSDAFSLWDYSNIDVVGPSTFGDQSSNSDFSGSSWDDVYGDQAYNEGSGELGMIWDDVYGDQAYNEGGGSDWPTAYPDEGEL